MQKACGLGMLTSEVDGSSMRGLHWPVPHYVATRAVGSKRGITEGGRVINGNHNEAQQQFSEAICEDGP